MNADLPDAAPIAQQHESLAAVVGRLTSSIADEGRTPEAVRHATRELVDELGTHFAAEEDGGYFTEAVRRAPRLEPLAKELQAEHAPLAESARALDTLVASPGESADWWDGVEADAKALAEKLTKHEAGERELLQRAYSEDLGSKD